MGVVTLRSMSGLDVAPCAQVFDDAIDRLRRDLSLPGGERSRGGAAARIASLLDSDPTDALVAEADGAVVGFAQATRRGNCWTLAHLFVDPDRQSSGVGTSLLAAVHAGGTGLPVGLIGSTADRRAIRAYARLPGFRLHPTVRADGPVTSPPDAHSSVVGASEPLEEVAAIDLAVRGSARTADIRHLLAEGYELRSIPGRGYALTTETSIATIAALDDTAASMLLEDALSRMADVELELPRMTADQHWAIAVAVAAGLRLRPWGPLMVRGLDRPPSPYLPHPALS